MPLLHLDCSQMRFGICYNRIYSIVLIIYVCVVWTLFRVLYYGKCIDAWKYMIWSSIKTMAHPSILVVVVVVDVEDDDDDHYFSSKVWKN